MMGSFLQLVYVRLFNSLVFCEMAIFINKEI